LNGVHFGADAALWSVLEQFKFTKAEGLSVIDHQHKKIGSIGFEELMAAFYKYKKQQPHE